MSNNWTTGTDRYNFYGLLIPQNVQVAWLGTNLRVSWNEIYEPDVIIEVWDSINGASPVLAAVSGLGASSVTFAAATGSTHNITVRVKNKQTYSQFSEPQSVQGEEFYYIDPAGVDDPARSGSNIEPFLTLAYAATRAITPGDVIHVNVGTYVETSQTVLAEGVSILGADEATCIIEAGANLEPMILMQSTLQNAQGNQSISTLTLDGNLTSNFGVACRRRSNVVFEHITVKDFVYTGVEIYGGSGFASTPTTYLSGIRLRYATMENCCSRRDPGIFGTIRMGGTIGAEIHDCTLTQTGRALGTNGNLIYFWGAINKGTKFYNNTCTKPASDGVIVGNGNGWNFHIESGFMEGFEVYDNTFVGGVALDLAGGNQVKGSYNYSWYVHDNEFSITAQIAPLAAGTHVPYAMDFERTNEDIIVTRNKFTNYPTAINFTISDSIYTKTRIQFTYNMFLSCGYTDASYGFGAIYFKGSYTAVGDLYTDIDFCNNVCVANGARAFFALQTAHNIKRLTIVNNVFLNSVTYGYLTAFGFCGDSVTPTGTFTEFRVENNLIHNNAHANSWYGIDAKTISFISYINNILATDPLFIGGGDYHLQAGSPCINTGRDFGLLLDYDSVPVSNPPDIGCYEYV